MLLAAWIAIKDIKPKEKSWVEIDTEFIYYFDSVLLVNAPLQCHSFSGRKVLHCKKFLYESKAE